MADDLHYRAECETCGQSWTSSFARSLGREHGRAYGHVVRVVIGADVTWFRPADPSSSDTSEPGADPSPSDDTRTVQP